MVMMEMSRNLRQTVDNSLEEGQFENAILSLDQVRADYHRPSVIHLLHLFFIALHPADHAFRLDDPSIDPSKLLLQSPRKIVKQGKAALVLSPDTVQAARRLLYAFLNTNGPSAFADALPAIPESKNALPYECEFVDSPIFNQSSAIRNARNVWEVLKPQYTKKTQQMYSTPVKGRGKPPRLSAASSLTNVLSSDSDQAVADDSWSFLEFLVTLFEQDAEATHMSGLPKHSPMLLKQIPPPPMGSTKDSRRRKTGIRLLLLLIDLTQSKFLSLPAFASATLTHLSISLSSSSPSVSPENHTPKNSSPQPEFPFPSYQEAFNSLFSSLPYTPPVLAFKLALCRQILSELEGQPTPSSALHTTQEAAAPLDLNPTTRSGLRRTSQPPANPKALNSFDGSMNSIAPAPSKPKPRPRPKPKQKIPLQSSDTLAADETNAAIVKSEAVLPTSSAKSLDAPAPSIQSVSSAPTPSAVSAAAAAATPPVPPEPSITLPPLGEFSHLLFIRAHESAHQHEASPWTRPPELLARVRFELLMAWIGIWTRQKARRSEEVHTEDSAVPVEGDTGSEQLGQLIDAVFGPNASSVHADDMAMDVDSSNDPRDSINTFYHQALRAFAGLPVDMGSGL
ncbi:hypothetical protein CPC08DRAFT_759926 [Agrocybe pediades]|nr:hypothetical protein CPC08DRAFT_759926 [Agrocybe pediades]